MRTLIIAAVLMTVMFGAVYSQSVGGWDSPQSQATQGRIRSDADNFIRPDGYTNLNLKSWYAMTSFTSGSSVHLGYAAKLDSLYIAAYYGGSFWAGFNNNPYTETNITWLDSGIKTIPVYNTLPTVGTPNNRVALLLGFANMGFRFNFHSTYQSFSDSDFRARTMDLPATDPPTYSMIDYKNYEIKNGAITPQLAWSLTTNLTSNGVRPWMTIDLGFVRNYTMQEVYIDNITNGTEITTSENYTQPVIAIGLGGYTFVNRNGFRGSFDLTNTITLRSYNNDYHYWDGNSNKIKTIKGYGTPGALTERSYFQNVFTPSVAGQWSVGTLACRFQFNLPLTIRNERITNMAFKDGSTNGDLVKEGVDSKTNTVLLAPDLRLALQWRIISRLALNAGGRITVSSYTSATTNGSSYIQDKEIENSSIKRVAKTYGGTSNQLTAGLTFNATDNMTFEVSSGISNNNAINIFGNTDEERGIFYFSNLLFSMKF
jgi:hypothetical protein